MGLDGFMLVLRQPRPMGCAFRRATQRGAGWPVFIASNPRLFVGRGQGRQRPRGRSRVGSRPWQISVKSARTSKGARCFLLQIDAWSAWPDELALPTPFCLLLVGNAAQTGSEVIELVARRAFDAGCAYVCAWGPDCERVHDRFDLVAIQPSDDAKRELVMTTWHADQPLRDAVFFAVWAAYPDDAFGGPCRSVLAVVVDNSDWAAEVMAGFADPESLY